MFIWPAQCIIKQAKHHFDSCADAYEDEEGRVIVDSVQLPELVDFASISENGGDFRNVDFEAVPKNTLWRHVITLPNMAAGEPGGVVSNESLPLIVEFPRINGAYFGRKHRFIYMCAVRSPSTNQSLQAWTKYDTATGSTDTANFG